MARGTVDIFVDINGYYVAAGSREQRERARGRSDVAAGTNVTITPTGNTLTIDSTGRGPAGPTGPIGPRSDRTHRRGSSRPDRPDRRHRPDRRDRPDPGIHHQPGRRRWRPKSFNWIRSDKRLRICWGSTLGSRQSGDRSGTLCFDDSLHAGGARDGGPRRNHVHPPGERRGYGRGLLHSWGRDVLHRLDGGPHRGRLSGRREYRFGGGRLWKRRPPLGRNTLSVEARDRSDRDVESSAAGHPARRFFLRRLSSSPHGACASRVRAASSVPGSLNPSAILATFSQSGRASAGFPD